MTTTRVVPPALLLALALAVGGSFGCADLPTERAERDLEVGKVTVGGAAFEVRDGLATFHQARAGILELWLGAPAVVIEADLASHGVTDWSLELHNVMPAAVLEASASDGATVGITERASGSVTHRTYDLVLPLGSQIELTFGRHEAETVEPFRFAFLSDVQNGIDRFGDMVARINAEPDVSFVLSAGDLTQGGSADEMKVFQRELEALQVPLFSTIGNHDAPPDTPWHDWFGRGSFRFIHRDVLFSFIDSASATVAPMVYDWLDQWLTQGRRRVHVFTTHVPPLDPVGTRNASFGSRGEAGRLLAVLAEGDVDVTFYGHIHSYYAFENAGIPAFISGGGGAFEEKVDGIDRHFMVVDVDPRRGLTETRVVEID
jgi:Icc protein